MADGREFDLKKDDKRAIFPGANYVLPVEAPRASGSTLDLTTATKMVFTVSNSGVVVFAAEVLAANFTTATASMVACTFDVAHTVTSGISVGRDVRMDYTVKLVFAGRVENVLCSGQGGVSVRVNWWGWLV